VPARLHAPALVVDDRLEEAQPAHFTTEALPEEDPRTALPFRGGETAALERLHRYIWTDRRLSTYKETRNGLLGEAYSSKLSMWLAQGALSPRTVYEEVRRFESQVMRNKSTYWLIFELIWRDYFTYVYRKYGTAFFRPGGIVGEPRAWRYDVDAFAAWKEGRTGIPFIDANMRELARTGFMSNRGRQNVASFLTKDLGIDWRWGAEWFEHCLVDHDVYSNYGNWNYVAGVGNDPRENRYFNILSQATRYDEQGEYVRLWVPELQDVPGKQVHYFPVNHPQGTKDYPKPLVDARKWVKGGK
jgi:deoxyribodipyrimidine photo-lyase